MTIWDGGGIDTFDFSNYSGGLLVNLSPGKHSTTDDRQLAILDADRGEKAQGNIYNAWLYNEGINATFRIRHIPSIGMCKLGNAPSKRRLPVGASWPLARTSEIRH